MTAEPRVEDDDDSAFVWEGIGPANQGVTPERRGVQGFMQRVVRDVLAHPGDYGALRDPLVLLAENYARTCQTRDELTRRLELDAARVDERGAAAVLLRRVWRAQQPTGASGEASV